MEVRISVNLQFVIFCCKLGKLIIFLMRFYVELNWYEIRSQTQRAWASNMFSIDLAIASWPNSVHLYQQTTRMIDDVVNLI